MTRSTPISPNLNLGWSVLLVQVDLKNVHFWGLLKNLMLIESGKSLFLLHYFLHPYFITIAPLFRDLNLEALKREM